MKCPNCGVDDEDHVVDTRLRKDNTIRRNRQCLNCGYVFKTTEEYVPDEIVKSSTKRKEYLNNNERDQLRRHKH